MSAIVEEPDGINFEPIKVLIAVQDEFDLCDMAGPMEVFSWAQHDKKNVGE
jgi:putative intracellular protease/amidase